MKKRLFFAIIFASFASLFVFLVLPSFASAKVGVGVGLGKVQIDEPLSPGGIYKLPSLPVLNTGDEAGDYEVAVTYQHEQEQLRPVEAWFSFSPKTFYLEPGGSQKVDISLNLPVKAKPGDYFGYLEAHPTAKKEGVTIGVAAATKLYFTVKPSGVLGAAIARVTSWFEQNAPYSYWALAGLIALAIILVFRRFFALQFGIRRKGKKKPKKEAESEEE